MTFKQPFRTFFSFLFFYSKTKTWLVFFFLLGVLLLLTQQTSFHGGKKGIEIMRYG